MVQQEWSGTVVAGNRGVAGEHRDKYSVLAEVSALSVCRGHPHIVQLLDVWVQAKTTTLVMERYGTDLYNIWPERKASAAGTFYPAELRSIIGHVAKGLLHIHTVGMIHTDIKPQNILAKWQADRWHIVVADLGCVTQASRPFLTPHRVVDQGGRYLT